ncbi:MAG: hypothetical protein GY722_15445 [bacterium]|nr:hypothetical protein [bacterium]
MARRQRGDEPWPLAAVEPLGDRRTGNRSPELMGADSRHGRQDVDGGEHGRAEGLSPTIEGMMSWEEARKMLIPDFEVTQEDRREFRSYLLKVDVTVEADQRVVRFTDDLGGDESSATRDLAEGLEVDAACYDKLAFKLASWRKESQEELEPLLDSAVQLLVESMDEYQRNEMYVRWRDGQPVPARPSGSGFDGSYKLSFGGGAGGWSIGVFFDSGAFPAFEDTLKEIDEAKVKYARRIMSALGVH